MMMVFRSDARQAILEAVETRISFSAGKRSTHTPSVWHYRREILRSPAMLRTFLTLDDDFKKGAFAHSLSNLTASREWERYY
jgi:hypothetical protein